MILRKTYFMLAISAFTFFGLPALQTVVSLRDGFGKNRVALGTMGSEERSETNNNSEVKEKSGKEFLHANFLASSYLENRELLKFFVYRTKYSAVFLEVPTPPPERITA